MVDVGWGWSSGLNDRETRCNSKWSSRSRPSQSDNESVASIIKKQSDLKDGVGLETDLKEGVGLETD